MASEGDQSDAGGAFFDNDALDKATQEIEALTSRLPRHAIVSLAKEVVHRLADRTVDDAPTRGVPTDELIDCLARALIDPERGAALSFVESISRQGVSLEEIYLDYLAMAARRLGEWWENDLVSFVEVSVGAGRIYAIICSIQQHYEAAPVNPCRHAVFAAVPGETHTLGVTMAAELCRKRGWTVDLLVGRGHDDLIAAIQSTHCALVGLSASGHRSLTATIRLIVALRIAVPGVRIMVSGHLAVEQENLVGLVGADFAATDFDAAIETLEQIADEAPAADPDQPSDKRT